MFSAAPQRTGATAAAALKTPWGEPDLQGIWSGQTATPLQRPERWAAKSTLTPAEAEEYLTELLGRPGRDRRAQRGTEQDVAGAYNAVWRTVRRGLPACARRSSSIRRTAVFHRSPNRRRRGWRRRTSTCRPCCRARPVAGRDQSLAPERASADLQPRTNESLRRSRGSLELRALLRRDAAKPWRHLPHRPVAGPGRHLS